MDIIRTYTPDETGYKNLQKVADVLTAISTTGTTYTIENTYFDFGQNWTWTTIIANNPASCFGSYQAICPRDYEIIINAENILDAVNTITENRKNDEWTAGRDW